MQRREFIKTAGVAALAASAGAQAESQAEHQWKLVTTWPKNFPVLGAGANHLAELIGKMSGGRIEVRVFGAGELAPAFEMFDAVSAGTAQMGHGAAYYWNGKSEAAQFFTTVPFGLCAQEMDGWLYHGGGMELWQELYARFNLVPAAAGNTGVQMGGWFKKEINALEDLKDIKMRIPGLGGEVLKRAGGIPVNLPGGEIFTALQSGAIDATEWIGPYNDLAFGLYKAAKFYYYPGWHEPGATLEAMIHKPTFDALPEDLKTIVLTACKAVNVDILSEYMARNPAALNTLVDEHGVQMRAFPVDVLTRLRQLSAEVVAEVAEKDEFSRRVHASYQKFLNQSKAYSAISEYAYLHARDHL